MTDDLSKEMIKDVDKSTVISLRIIDSPVFGSIPPRDLSLLLKATVPQVRQAYNEFYYIYGDNVLSKKVVPESFEWLILKSGILSDREVREILEDPQDYIESERYFSWERFFAALLIEKIKDSY